VPLDTVTFLLKEKPDRFSYGLIKPSIKTKFIFTALNLQDFLSKKRTLKALESDYGIRRFSSWMDCVGTAGL
jgi:hypothetical protein